MRSWFDGFGRVWAGVYAVAFAALAIINSPPYAFTSGGLAQQCLFGVAAAACAVAVFVPRRPARIAAVTLVAAACMYRVATVALVPGLLNGRNRAAGIVLYTVIALDAVIIAMMVELAGPGRARR